MTMRLGDASAAAFSKKTRLLSRQIKAPIMQTFPMLERNAWQAARQPPMAILKAEHVSKDYASGGGRLTVLKEVSFQLEPGSSCAIIGPSGSGKTTLLGLCAGLDVPSEGKVILDGKELQSLTENERAALRRERTGFIFQSFQLMPSLTALENVLLPLELLGQKPSADEAISLLDRVGLKDRVEHYPLQLSGGEQQRVAIARAFIHRPAVLFADEPTGNLDAETSQTIVDMMFALNREAGTALLMVTHDPDLARQANRTMTMAAGRLESVVENAASV
jgi:putative ABC transport system ATP-binding protein